MGPPDPILGLTESFAADKDPRKVSLGVGAYRGDDGKPLVLESVKTAERRIVDSNSNKEYAGIAGLKSFVDLSLEFAYGKDSPALKEGRVAGVQVRQTRSHAAASWVMPISWPRSGASCYLYDVNQLSLSESSKTRFLWITSVTDH